MGKSVDFYFDFGSPAAYLAHRRIEQLQEQLDAADVHYIPMLLGGVFKATGNSSPVALPAKAKYMLEQDLPRFAKRYKVPLNFSPHFPINTLHLMRGAIAAQQMDCFAHYVKVVFEAIWVEGANMGDASVVEQQLSKAGLDAPGLMALTQQDAIKAKLISNTETAVERGAFGAPTFYIGKDMYFGQDRMEFIEAALRN